MSGFNKVILMGNLTRDPELKYTTSGMAVCELGLAVNTPRGKGDDKKDEVLFISATAWDKQAETCAKYLAKGRQVLIEGRLKLDEWTDKDSGQKRTKISVVAQNIQFIGGKDSEKQDKPNAGNQRNSDPREPLDSKFDTPDDVPF